MKKLPKVGRPQKMNLVKYLQFLFVSQKNYTLTYLAKYLDGVSHDAINNYLSDSNLRPQLLWKHISKEIVFDPEGYIIFDDTVLNKNDSNNIDLVRFQYSGREKAIIKGITIVTCVYYNPKLKRFWAIDYRIYVPEQDGKTKVEHLIDMLKSIHFTKKIPYSTVLVDTWYATAKVLLLIEELHKKYCCTIRDDRLVSRVDKYYGHFTRVSHLEWSAQEEENGIRICLKNFPYYYHVQLFRMEMSSGRAEYVITNDLSQGKTLSVQEVFGYRFVIEQLHRELKTLTGISKCQCRKQRIQRNHIACAFLVWAKLKAMAYKFGKTIYEIKDNLLGKYMKTMIQEPAIFITS